MYKIKQNRIYALEYAVKLNNGKAFKANNELKNLQSRLNSLNCEEEIDEERVSVVSRMIENKKLAIKNYKKLSQDSQIELDLVNSGEKDEELNELYIDKKEKKEERKLMKDTKKKEINETNKKKSKDYYQNSYQSRRKERFLQKDLNYHYKLYVNKSKSIPHYLKKKLRYLPNNHGIIYKGVWWFGELPDKNDGTLFMSEYTYNKVYFKNKDENGVWTITSKNLKKKSNFR